MQKHWILGSAATLLLFAAQAHAAVIGVIGNNLTAETALQGIIAGQGHTAVSVTTVDAASLAGLDVLWGLNSSNSTQIGALVGNSDLNSFVAAGGVFVYHDRQVDDAETVLPGGAGLNIIRDFTDSSNIQVVDSTTTVTNGPGGIIADTTLDGGTSSSHGYTVAGSLPGTALEILSRSVATEVVDFVMQVSAGDVYYSTIPLDYYLAGATSNLDFVNIYAPNMVAYAAELAGDAGVPVPATLALLGLGLLGIGCSRRSKAV